MKVKDIIERLQQEDPDTEVFIGFPMKDYLQRTEVVALDAIGWEKVTTNPVTKRMHLLENRQGPHTIERLVIQ